MSTSRPRSSLRISLSGYHLIIIDTHSWIITISVAISRCLIRVLHDVTTRSCIRCYQCLRMMLFGHRQKFEIFQSITQVILVKTGINNQAMPLYSAYPVSAVNVIGNLLQVMGNG